MAVRRWGSVRSSKGSSRALKQLNLGLALLCDEPVGFFFFYLFRSLGSYWPLFREHPPSNITRCYCPLRTTKAMALVTDPTVCQRPGAQRHRPNYPMWLSGCNFPNLPAPSVCFSLFWSWARLPEDISSSQWDSLLTFLLFSCSLLQFHCSFLSQHSQPDLTPLLIWHTQGRAVSQEKTGCGHEKWKEPLQDEKRPHQ